RTEDASRTAKHRQSRETVLSVSRVAHCSICGLCEPISRSMRSAGIRSHVSGRRRILSYLTFWQKQDPNAERVVFQRPGATAALQKPEKRFWKSNMPGQSPAPLRLQLVTPVHRSKKSLLRPPPTYLEPALALAPLSAS